MTSKIPKKTNSRTNRSKLAKKTSSKAASKSGNIQSSSSSATAASFSKTISPAQQSLQNHIIFVPLIIFSLILWSVYRQLFDFPVWFDEILGKAIFFGLPVWLYVVSTDFQVVADTFSKEKLEKGLLLGLAVGGIYGFVTAAMAVIQSGGAVQSAALFTSNLFWYEFALALFTGFWETLFFYSFVAGVVLAKYKHWSLLWQFGLIVFIFIIFHLPNIISRFSLEALPGVVLMLTLFALGQALLFYRWRNGYALVLSQAIWGMVLLVHGGGL